MEKIFDSINSANSFPDAILKNLNKQKKEDILYVKENYKDGLCEEKLDQIEIDYDLSMEKYDYIPELICRDESLQKKFTHMALYIDYLDLDLGRKLDAILTFGVIISTSSNHVEFLSDEMCYLLSTSMSSLTIKDISTYSDVLANEELLTLVMNKTEDMNERRKIIYNLIDYFDDAVYKDMSNEEFSKVILKCHEIIDNYEVKSIEASKVKK